MEHLFENEKIIKMEQNDVVKKKSKSQYRSVRYRVNIHLPRTNSLHLQANPVKKDQPIDKALHPSEQYIHTFNTFMTIQRNRKRLILSEPNEETIQGSSLFTFESMHHSVLRADDTITSIRRELSLIEQEQIRIRQQLHNFSDWAGSELGRISEVSLERMNNMENIMRKNYARQQEKKLKATRQLRLLSSQNQQLQHQERKFEKKVEKVERKLR